MTEADSIPSLPWWRNDAMIFAALVALAVVAFTTTYFISKAYARREDSLAREWYRRGESDLASSQPKSAIADFRTALRYSRDNPQYRLRLAEALAADNDTQQAVAYFQNLWEAQPGSGQLNLELARLYARDRQPHMAERFYHGAIFGLWPDDPGVRRREVRNEYIRFLLQQNQVAPAQAEAFALAAAVPPSDITGHLQAADLLLTTGDSQHALAEYTAILKAAPAEASLGAGKAAFQLGWFRTAAEHLRSAIQHGSTDPAAKTMLDLAESVLNADPAQRHLSMEDRLRRVSTAYVQAGARLQQCAMQKQQQLETTAPITDLQQLYAEWATTGPELPRLKRDPDRRDAVMDLIFRIENTTARECGPPTGGPDWALLTLSRYGEGVEQ